MWNHRRRIHHLRTTASLHKFQSNFWSCLCRAGLKNNSKSLTIQIMIFQSADHCVKSLDFSRSLSRRPASVEFDQCWPNDPIGRCSLPQKSPRDQACHLNHLDLRPPSLTTKTKCPKKANIININPNISPQNQNDLVFGMILQLVFQSPWEAMWASPPMGLSCPAGSSAKNKSTTISRFRFLQCFLAIFQGHRLQPIAAMNRTVLILDKFKKKACEPRNLLTACWKLGKTWSIIWSNKTGNMAVWCSFWCFLQDSQSWSLQPQPHLGCGRSHWAPTWPSRDGRCRCLIKNRPLIDQITYKQSRNRDNQWTTYCG